MYNSFVALQGLFGFTGIKNVQGEEVQKLDVIANDHWIDGIVVSIGS